MCFYRILGGMERMERGFPWVSHRQSLCEYFPLHCVANLALGQASKCRPSPWKGVPVPSLPRPIPSPAATTQGPAFGWQILCVAARKSHFPYLPSMPPTGLPYAAGSRKRPCLELWNTHSLKSQMFTEPIKLGGGGFRNSLLTSLLQKRNRWAVF